MLSLAQTQLEVYESYPLHVNAVVNDEQVTYWTATQAPDVIVQPYPYGQSSTL